jgi:hypothetical protein
VDGCVHLSYADAGCCLKLLSNKNAHFEKKQVLNHLKLFSHHINNADRSAGHVLPYSHVVSLDRTA